MNRVFFLAFLGMIKVNSVFAQLEKFDELLPMIFVEGNVQIADFYIGKFEVTQEAWMAVMGNNPAGNKAGGKYPVEMVSWNDVQEFLIRLNALTGRSYRLPTHAEWLFAARGGTQSQGYRYSGSNNLNDVAWYRVNSRGINGNRNTYPVGRKQSNELGIYDMSGNVAEFFQGINPTNPNSLSGYVIGGSFHAFAGASRIDKNVGGPVKWVINQGAIYIGFRVAYTTPDAQPVPEIPPLIENIPTIVESADMQPVVENTPIDGIPTNKGNTFINANTTNFGIINFDGTTFFDLNVNVGYFVANRFAFIGGLGYEYEKDKTNNINLKTGFRFYMVKANKSGLFFNSWLNAAKSIDTKFDLFGLTIGGGYSFFPNNRVAFEPTVNFIIPFEEGVPNIFVFGCGFSIFF